jgi:hypothetical protein
MPRKQPVRVSDDTLRELHAAGHGCNEIARRTGTNPATVSRRCKTLGLTFDRRQTAAGVAARSIDARARRVAIIDRLYARAEKLLDRLDADTFWTLMSVGAGEQQPTELNFVPAVDERYLAHSIGSYLQSAGKLEAIDADAERNAELAQVAVGLGKAIAVAAEQYEREQRDAA